MGTVYTTHEHNPRSDMVDKIYHEFATPSSSVSHLRCKPTNGTGLPSCPRQVSYLGQTCITYHNDRPFDEEFKFETYLKVKFHLIYFEVKEPNLDLTTSSRSSYRL